MDIHIDDAITINRILLIEFRLLYILTLKLLVEEVKKFGIWNVLLLYVAVSAVQVSTSMGHCSIRTIGSLKVDLKALYFLHHTPKVRK